jgi:hypothetical protein
MNKLDEFQIVEQQTIEQWTRVDETNVHLFCTQPLTYGEYLLASYDGVFNAANPDKAINSFDRSYGFSKKRSLSYIIPYIYNMDNNTSTKHVKIELFIKSGSN